MHKDSLRLQNSMLDQIYILSMRNVRASYNGCYYSIKRLLKILIFLIFFQFGFKIQLIFHYYI